MWKSEHKVLSLALVAAWMFATPAHAQTAAEIALYKGPDRQAKLEEGARKEGKVTIYSGLIVEQAMRPIADAFQKKYPYIKLSSWRGESIQILQKFMAEARANAVEADVLDGNALTPALTKAKLLLPFWTPAMAYYPATGFYADGTYIANRYSYMGPSYNTKQVSEADIPKNYNDLLNPKWKGKMAWSATFETGAPLFITNLRLYMGEEKAEAYLQELKKQNVASIAGAPRNVINKLMEGEYSIALGMFLHHAMISKAQGASVTSVPMEPIAAFHGGVVLPRAVKNPHAAMLLIDFMVGEEGQKILADAGYFPVNPKVQAEASIRSVSPAASGVKDTVLTAEKMEETLPRSIELYEKYFK
jgi:iron(III) transport system substrate-binding protein